MDLRQAGMTTVEKKKKIKQNTSVRWNETERCHGRPPGKQLNIYLFESDQTENQVSSCPEPDKTDVHRH